MRRYTFDERGRYEPPACPGCGFRVLQGWIDVTMSLDLEPMYTPGRWECRTPDCQYNVRIVYITPQPPTT